MNCTIRAHNCITSLIGSKLLHTRKTTNAPVDYHCTSRCTARWCMQEMCCVQWTVKYWNVRPLCSLRFFENRQRTIFVLVHLVPYHIVRNGIGAMCGRTRLWAFHATSAFMLMCVFCKCGKPAKTQQFRLSVYKVTGRTIPETSMQHRCK